MIELLIAMAIVAVLSAVAVPLYRGYREKAAIDDTIVQMRTIETRIEAYRTEFGKVPASLTGVLSPVPKDRWGNDFEYLDVNSTAPGVAGKRRKDRNLVPINSDYDLYSKGPDGQSAAPLTSSAGRDDVVRANDGTYMGLASDY